MRNKIIIALFALFALFLMGAGITMLYIYKTTSNLQSVINLHQVEIVRQDLVISAQTVQSHLYTIGTAFGPELDVIVDNVIDLDTSVKSCLKCHHTKEMTEKLQYLVNDVEQFKDALSSFITTSANKDRIEKLRNLTITLGNNLLAKTQEMSLIAGQKLNNKTIDALKEINNSKVILILTLVLSFFIALAISIGMTRQITEPIYELLNATRKIKAGELGYTTNFKGKNEFGELIESFNDMSESLMVSNRTIMNQIHNLSNLYSLTLSFHTVTSESEIYKEVSHGVAELIGAEQCGLILMGIDSFVHKTPSFGVPDNIANSINIPVESLLDFYGPLKKKAVILNDSLDSSPTAVADKMLNVRNLLFVGVRHKGELVGLLRVANKISSEFSEDDVRLLAILANNVSVAIENIRLYEDLRKQMGELKNTQEQLIQAAKLAAIGELASNIAHEINNPLTSILGYAELIKEENDLANIIRDADVIEKESLRAREIVHQLLEFSRKRPLTVTDIDINKLLKEVVDLSSFQLKETAIRLTQDFGVIPRIEADPNQLKQVFLNIINNAVYAMHNSGSLEIQTSTTGDYVVIEIRDTGKGIPKEIQNRIFEPFFTTKKEKGTGLGLSISYKIIQSHGGKIDLETEEGVGTKFRIILPKHKDTDNFKMAT